MSSPGASPGHGSARFLRALLLAAFSVALAVVGHALGGGRLPTLTALALALGFASTGCWALAGRQRRTLGLLAASAGAQLASHVVFSLDRCSLGAMTHGGGRMLFAHLIMTVVAAGALARVDALIWLLYRFLGRDVATRLPSLPMHDVLVRMWRRATARPSFSCWAPGAHPRRGPPLPATA